ncbi:serine protease [Culex quinquefasciatus]|uniref:Serine protease n=1 Tax=Culex quinquefasciatus TaxID=7176 RepID=B0W269_CULQU|nr:serine protease [Culex quinquefasciatus]|eukprot:XP_001842768.1 serine protease [Culex quinquefasciatus]
MQSVAIQNHMGIKKASSVRCIQSLALFYHTEQQADGGVVQRFSASFPLFQTHNNNNKLVTIVVGNDDVPSHLVVGLLHVRRKEEDQSTESCGLQKIKPKNLPPRENAAYPGQFPWHVAVYHRITRNQAIFVCGGSLISRSFVLTADHCTRTATGAELESDGLLVQLGLHDLESTNWATFQQSAVEDIFRVSDGARWAGMRNDIALLELSSRVRFSNYVQPICLGRVEQFVGIGGMVAGWGLSEGDDLRFLRTTSLKDIGGGLFAKENDDVWFLVGIAAFSESELKSHNCHSKGSFTDVQTYLPWIGAVTGMQFDDSLSEIQPICLWQLDPALEKIVNRIGYLVGHGTERFNQQTKILKEFPMPIASASDCMRDHDRFTRLYVKSRTFCAGLRNGTGPDFGDTGGGLFLEDGGKWFLRGVLSKMVPTNEYDGVLKTKFAIFADITYYLNWIDATLRENS